MHLSTCHNRCTYKQTVKYTPLNTRFCLNNKSLLVSRHFAWLQFCSSLEDWKIFCVYFFVFGVNFSRFFKIFFLMSRYKRCRNSRSINSNLKLHNIYKDIWRWSFDKLQCVVFFRFCCFHDCSTNPSLEPWWSFSSWGETCWNCFH